MIHLHTVSKQYGSKILFNGADAHIGHRSKVALIGPNGAGKSTLIRIILGLESADAGHVTKASHLSIGHLAQEVPKFSGRSVLAEVMRLDGRREDLLEAKQELEQKLSTEDPTSEAYAADLERYGRILEEFEQMDEYRLESRAKEILTGIGFHPKDFDRSLTEFSGGWLMRVALARILLMDPDLLLLDEPTNHLDLESLLWLEDFLKGFRGAMLLVSHDTEFLNRMVSEVLEIDQQQLFVYRGNLEDYARQKEERLVLLQAQYRGQQAKMADLENFIRRFGAKATKARQAQSRMKQLEKLEENKIELPEDRSTVRFRFPPAPHSGKEVVTMRRAGLSYGDPESGKEKKVFENLDWVIRRGSRVAVVGVNGAGKTSLLKLLSGRLTTTSGECKMGHMVEVGYYAQLQAESLDLSKTILQELEKTAPHLMISQVRAIAGAFLFSGDAVNKKCAVLSGGEKARVALAKLLLAPSNFLILDEPTNHLDVESRGVLLDALQDYEGTLCLVSHDRGFVGPLVDAVLEIEPSQVPGQGARVTQLIGSYDEYLERKVREISQRSAQMRADSSAGGSSSSRAGEVKKPETAKKGGPSNNQKQAWEKERVRIEGEITKLESERGSLTEVLSQPDVYADKARSLTLIEQQRTLEKTLSDKLARWEELCGYLGV